jgi:hypothetical protein
MTEVDAAPRFELATEGVVSELTAEGWLMRWGETPADAFQVLCPKGSPEQLGALQRLISEGHRLARERFNVAEA